MVPRSKEGKRPMLPSSSNFNDGQQVRRWFRVSKCRTFKRKVALTEGH